MYIFLIHPSVDGHLGCSHVLAIVNSAACIFLNYDFLQVHTQEWDSRVIW